MKLKPKWHSTQLMLFSDTLNETLEPCGTENMQLEKLVPAETRRYKSQPLHFWERKIIESMIIDGRSLSCIAVYLSRGRTTILFEVKRNGGRDVYTATKAQENAEQNRMNRNLKTSQSVKGRIANPYNVLKQRIENLEMQLEILSETIKEITYERNNNRI